MRPQSLTAIKFRAIKLTATFLTSPASAAHSPLSASTLNDYASTIEDSAVSRPSKVVSGLLVPDISDPRTHWREINGGSPAAATVSLVVRSDHCRYG